MSKHAREVFLRSANRAGAALQPVAQDASARRYWRVTQVGQTSAVLMHTPLATEADRAAFRAFLELAAYLRENGLAAPEVYSVDRAQGFALIEDLGTDSLARLLETDRSTARAAYQTAAELSLHLSQCTAPEWVARPGQSDLVAMVDLTLDRLDAPAALREDLTLELGRALDQHAAGQAALALRDYHADNLMWCADRAGLARIGLLDFQDAVVLPLGYDLASLIDDPRRVVPEGWRQELIADFAARLGVDGAAMTRRINALSLLRNLRILGVFHRLATDAERPHYAAYLPRTTALIARAARDPGLAGLARPVAALLAQASAWDLAVPS